MNTATTPAATAEAMAAQSVAFSDKASVCKLSMMDWPPEETDDPLYADRRSFYKVEKWSKDGLRIEELLFAGNSLAEARRIFDRFIQRRPR